jgi:hypothetical protein
MNQQIESGHGTTNWLTRKWDAEQTEWARRRADRKGIYRPLDDELFALMGVRPYAEVECHGNLITTVGWARLGNLLTNQSATQAMDATHTRLGVGDGGGSAPTPAYGDTDFAASSNKWWTVIAAALTIGTRKITGSATFDGTHGNFAWNEAGLDIGSTSAGATVAAALFNHGALSGQGTKPSSQTWTLNAEIDWT